MKRLDPSVKFYKMPKDPVRRKLWASFCDTDWRDTRKKLVCHKHFEKSAYSKSQRVLLRAAVPTLYPKIDKFDQLVSISDIMIKVREYDGKI